MAAKRKSKTSKRTNTTAKGGRQAFQPIEPQRGEWPSAAQSRSAVQSRQYAFRRS